MRLPSGRVPSGNSGWYSPFLLSRVSEVIVTTNAHILCLWERRYAIRNYDHAMPGLATPVKFANQVLQLPSESKPRVAAQFTPRQHSGGLPSR